MFWSENIGLYADKKRSAATIFAVIAAVLSGITGLGVWATLTESVRLYAVIAVSLVGFATVFAAAVLKYGGYAESAAAAAPLTSEYGHVRGELVDALAVLKSAELPEAHLQASEAVTQFEEVKRKKDELPGIEKFRRKLEKTVRRRYGVAS